MDALCGPSNALQSFQKHSQVDRTLQQDRLTGPQQSPGHGFRSHDPRSGSLDADFHAFETAAPSPFPHQDHIASSHPFIPLTYQQPGQTVGGWANDFQRLQIRDQPIPPQQFRAEAPLIRSAHGGWQNEFMKQRQNVPSAVAQGKQVAGDQSQTQSGTYQAQMNHYQNDYGSMAYHNWQGQHAFSGRFGEGTNDWVMQDTGNHLRNDEGRTADQIAPTEWAQAFEEIMQSTQESEQTSNLLQNDISKTSEARLSLKASSDDMQMQNIQQPDNVRIGSDAIKYTESKDRTVEQAAHDANSLARVAGELLHNVQHDSSDKFQNSQFLNLMRKIRDRQVEVRNNDFESTQNNNLLQPGETIVSQADREAQQKMTDPASQNHFQFPDMDAVYEPDPAVDMTDYSFDADQYPSQPRTQIQDLHPGGRFYPGLPGSRNAQMSGGVGHITSEDFDTHDERQDFAARYRKPMVEDASAESA